MKENKNIITKIMKSTITNPQLKSTPHQNNVSPQNENSERDFIKEFEYNDLNDRDDISEKRNESFYSTKSNDSFDISSNFYSKVDYRRFKPVFQSGVWEIDHSRRKLPCICESPNAPIPRYINIPKIKIFKGFPKVHK